MADLVTSSKKTLYIYVGPPGTGKTTSAKTCNDVSCNTSICEADLFEKLYTRTAINIDLLNEAHTWCKNSVRDAMIRGDDTIVQSNTNLYFRQTCVYFEMACEYGYDVVVVSPEPGNLLHYPSNLSYSQQKEHIKYVRSGNIEGEKEIPAQKMDEMILQFERIVDRIREIQTELGTENNDPGQWILKIDEKFPIYTPTQKK